MAQAEEALKLIRVEYQPLPFVVDMDDALKAGAPKVYDAETAAARRGRPARRACRSTATCAGRRSRAAATSSARVRRRRSRRSRASIAPKCRPIAAWSRTASSPTGATTALTVYISTQFTAGVRRELAQAFDLPIEKVRVVVDGMGGGFGSKSTLGNYGRLAVALSRQAGAPVRLTLTRPEEQMDSGNRPSVRQRIRLGASRDGTLTAMAIESHGTAGVGLGAGVGNFAQAIYDCAEFRLRAI